MLIATNDLLIDMLNAALEHVVAGNYSGPLYQPYVGLLKGAFTPSGLLTLADVTEADYTGYARKQITTWSPTFISQTGNPAFASETTLFFQPSGTITVENVVSGWMLVSASTAGILLATELFQTPIPLGQLTDALDLDVLISMSASAGIGGSQVLN